MKKLDISLLLPKCFITDMYCKKKKNVQDQLQTGAATVENSMAFPQKPKNVTAI